MRGALEQAMSGAWGWRLTWFGVVLAAAGGLLGLAAAVGVPWIALDGQTWHRGWMIWAVVLTGVGSALGGLVTLGWVPLVVGALTSFEAGERDAEALRIAAAGPSSQASGWNRLMAWIGGLQHGSRVEQAEDAMLTRQDRPGDASLASAVDALWMGLLLLDEHLTVQHCNSAAASLLRHQRDDLVGSAIGSTLTDERLLKAAKSVASGLIRRKCTVDVEQSSEDGSSSVLRCTFRPVRRTESTVVLMVIEDVTQQHEADKARTELVAQAAHELRTPLTNIRLYTEELIEGLGEMTETERGEALSTVSQETRRLERIVSDMLSMSEIEAGELSIVQDDVRMEDVISVLRNDYNAQAREAGLSLQFEVGPKMPVLHGDRDKITLAMHNLVSNAIKYTPPGGTVTVRADSDGERFVFEVVDSGVGIAPEQVERIFERFYRCKDDRTLHVPGTGLGLSLARDVARLHGGDVTAHSVPDQGSRFVLELPMAA